MNAPRSWPDHVYRALWSGLDLLFPPACAGCGRQGHRICPECLADIRPLQPPLCEICGLPQDAARVCAQCRAAPPAYDILRSMAAFKGPLRAIIHSLKYRRDLSLGDALATPAAVFARQLNWSPDIIIPIPLGRRRLRERGYNQVAMFARPLASALNLGYAPGALRRVLETRTQVGLTGSERRINVQNAFRAEPRAVEGKTVLLVDDVATSGATLSSAAMSLRIAGAAGVLALTVARALPRHGLEAA